jgi:hypothetical protein
MNSATTLMPSHVWPDFNPSNINHELCHYTDDVTRIAGLQPPATSTMNSATTLMTSQALPGRQSNNWWFSTIRASKIQPQSEQRTSWGCICCSAANKTETFTTEITEWLESMIATGPLRSGLQCWIRTHHAGIHAQCQNPWVLEGCVRHMCICVPACVRDCERGASTVHDGYTPLRWVKLRSMCHSHIARQCARPHLWLHVSSFVVLERVGRCRVIMEEFVPHVTTIADNDRVRFSGWSRGIGQN